MKPAPDPVPRFARFQWPKIAAPLSPEGQRISDEFVRLWHEVLPQRYGVIEKFNHGYPRKFLPDQRPFRTIELGAGIGAHVGFEDLSIQEYHCVELRENMIAEIRRKFPNVTAVKADCQERLPYADAYFDRGVVVHVLEHLPNLPAAVGELHRLLKPGALFSLVLPCDPGLAYELARKISAEHIFRKHFQMPYTWLIRREHINNPKEILSVMQNGFSEIDRAYFPLPLPIIWANLVMGVTYRRLESSS